jgi:hypothetical protein
MFLAATVLLVAHMAWLSIAGPHALILKAMVLLFVAAFILTPIGIKILANAGEQEYRP